MKRFNNFLINHRERVVGLDILRSIAILIVVYEHAGRLIPEQYQELYQRINFFKIDGVSIFFVLSGYLIGGILLRTINNHSFNRKDLLNFWIRRWFRTIPNYFIVLVILLANRFLVYSDFGDFNFKYLFFSQNFLSLHPDFFPEAWSLTVEEWFYVLFPLSCYAFYKMLKNKSNSILLSAFIFLFIPLLIRIVKYEFEMGVHGFDLEIRKIVLFRLDSIMYGVIAAYIQFKQPKSWQNYNRLFLATGVLLILLLNVNPLNWKNFYLPLSFNIECITTFCFLPFLSAYKTTTLKILDAFFIFISIISYSMYLLNFTPIQLHLIPVMDDLLNTINFPTEDMYLINYIMLWFFTILGSYLLYRIYENPITKLRDKIKIR